jgi:hypothetical protein
MKVRILLAVALVSASALPAVAQSVKVAFHGGKVDLSAENATVRAILAEWARVGGTRLVNAERLAGPPVTVEFKDAYERQALEALLRGVSGYIVGPRLAGGTPASSGFDRIVILATSNAPRPNNPAPVASRPPGPQPLRRIIPGDDDQQPDIPVDGSEPVTIGGTPGQARPESPADLRRRLGQLVTTDQREPEETPPPAPQPAASTPSNPFGVTTGAARPGVITPVPTPGAAQPRQTGGASTPGAAAPPEQVR